MPWGVPNKKGRHRFDGRTGRGRHLDGAVVFDVYLRAGLFHDLADHLAAGADHFTYLVGGDFHGLDARCMFAKAGAGRPHSHSEESTAAWTQAKKEAREWVIAAGDAS